MTVCAYSSIGSAGTIFLIIATMFVCTGTGSARVSALCAAVISYRFRTTSDVFQDSKTLFIAILIQF